MEHQPDDTFATARDALLEAALPHVAFDGWSEATLRAAIAQTGVAEGLARAIFPRGGVDLALAYHRQGDAAMTEALAGADLAAMRYSARVAHAIRVRLELADREAVRRGTTLLALPQHAAEGARAVWGTADAIWKALGDSSRDLNFYTKRATLSAVYASTVLYWLGDEQPGQAATWAFLDRRIEDVMRIEKLKASLRENPVVKAAQRSPFGAAFDWVSRQAVRPNPAAFDDLPGRLRP